MTVAAFAAIAVVIVVGACLQSAVGFGLGMLAAPVVAFFAPDLLPATLLLVTTILTLVVAIRERAHLDLHGTGWALAGRLPGGVAGALLLVVIPVAGIAWIVIVTVLIGVVLTVGGWRPAPSKRALVSAGFASGVMGTTTTIGGPPMALVWQGRSGARLRGSMAMFFLVGSLASLLALLATGSVRSEQLLFAAALALPALGGYALSHVIARFLNPSRTRQVAIVVSVLSVAILALQQVLGSA
ncbi:TSUP family transporter [uncultured Demequina sp.]|uniref:TSUP family transporter n=1 Tax=uncultured Demequina sp. TaxID=693499 RepID=UPI0025CD7A58|nr:TSUP family transporter [uncultured Demequina sp.]